MDGSLIGLSPFTFGGGPVDRNWGNVSLGAKWKVNKRMDAFSRISVAVDNQHSPAPDLGLSVSFQAGQALPDRLPPFTAEFLSGSSRHWI
jgi:uncharacterized protein YhjY with autotransporter beta-barrel domain